MSTTTCIRVRSRSAAYSSPIGGRLDASASRWREQCVLSVFISPLSQGDVYPFGTRKSRFLASPHRDIFSDYPRKRPTASEVRSLPDASEQPRIASAHVTLSSRCRHYYAFYGVFTSKRWCAFLARQTLSSLRALSLLRGTM